MAVSATVGKGSRVMQLSSGFIYMLHSCHQDLRCFSEDVHTTGEKNLKQAQVKASTGLYCNPFMREL